jgi:hypothetical protein
MACGLAPDRFVLSKRDLSTRCACFAFGVCVTGFCEESLKQRCVCSVPEGQAALADLFLDNPRVNAHFHGESCEVHTTNRAAGSQLRQKLTPAR